MPDQYKPGGIPPLTDVALWVVNYPTKYQTPASYYAVAAGVAAAWYLYDSPLNAIQNADIVTLAQAYGVGALVSTGAIMIQQVPLDKSTGY